MLKFVLIILMITFLFAVAGNAQQKLVPEVKYDFVDYIMPVIVSQPDCPLKVEYAIVAKQTTGNSVFYKVKNVGNKKVHDYTVATWFSDNTGNVLTGIMPNGSNLIKPGQTVNGIPDSLLVSDQNRKTGEVEKTGKGLKVIVFVMIVEIEFSDGSQYSAVGTRNALEEHLKMFEYTYDKLPQN
jgi:hypothetical protein